MPEKVVTLLLTVDLGCCRCKTKIQKVLCKLQRCEPIQEIAYDDKNNTVSVSGTFHPECLSKKLRCKACRVIKDIKIKPDDPPPPSEEEKKKEEKLKEEEKKAEEKSKEEEKKTEEPPPPPPPLKVIWEWPGDPPPWASACCFRPCPCYQKHQGCSRCCSCGKIVNGPSAPHYYPVPFYGGRGGHCDGVKIVCEEDPPYYACNVM